MKRLRTAIIIAAVSMAGLLTSCGSGIKMVKIPEMGIKMSATEITQKQYEIVMGENPSWYDAIYFCNKLSVKEGKTPVYAAKGGQNFKYSGSDNIDEVAWYEKTSNGVMHSVAQKKPNGYGLYDMSGNVREWGWDQDSFENRIICSGSFEGYAVYCQVDFANRLPSEYSYANIGFRIVCRAN